MSEQPAETSVRSPLADGADGEFTPAELLSRRKAGEPHPYVHEQRNPPNLWMLAAMTVGSLIVAAVVMVLTVLL